MVEGKDMRMSAYEKFMVSRWYNMLEVLVAKVKVEIDQYITRDFDCVCMVGQSLTFEDLL